MKDTKKAVKNVQTKKLPRRKVKLQGIITLAFAFTFIAFLFTSIFLKSLNVSLDMAKQDYQEQIAAIKVSNETLKYEVKELSNYDRIMNTVGTDMSANDDVVYTISD